MLDLKGQENIIFDLGGVLLNIDYDLTARAFKDLGLMSFDDIYSQKQQSGLFDRFETGKISSEEFLVEVGAVLPRASHQEIVDAWNAMLLDLPIHRLNLLNELGKEHRIFLLSNTNEIHEEAFLNIIKRAYGSNVLFDHFEVVHLSHKIGYRKPDAECFEFVLETSSLRPEETIFIDDSVQHIEGAKNLGIRSFLLQSGQEITQLFPDKSR